MKKNRSIKLLLMLSLISIISICTCACSKGEADNKITDNTNMSYVAAGEEGYYFISNGADGTYINYYPVEGTGAIPLCNKSDCEHSCAEKGCKHEVQSEKCGVKDCDAYIRDTNSRAYLSGIELYEGKLYMLLADDEGIHLYSVSLDGAERKKVCTLEGNANAEMGAFLINKDMVYYYIKEYNRADDSETIKIYRKDILENDERELVFEQTQPYIVINYMQGYEDGVYFVFGHMTDEDSNKAYEENVMLMELYKITDEGANKVIDSDDVNAYKVDGGILYYHRANGEVHRYDMSAGEDEIIYMEEKDMLYSMWIDEEYIYLDNDLGCNVYWFMDERIDRYITVLKKDGTFVRNINIDSDKYSNGILYGRGCDDKYMFFTNYISWFVYDKAQLETGGNELKKIFGYED